MYFDYCNRMEALEIELMADLGSRSFQDQGDRSDDTVEVRKYY